MNLNGSPVTAAQLKPLALTNYGHFTSMCVDNGQVRGLSLHMERLAHDCRHLFDVDLDTDLVRRYVRDAVQDSAPSVIARVTVYDPDLEIGNIGAEAKPQILVSTRAASTGVASPLRLQAVAYRREMPTVKHISLLGALKQRRDAQRGGYDDVLFLNPDGTISEIATSNIGFVQAGRIVWPRSEWLPGVTMTLINQALDEPIVLQPLTLADISVMDAVFATNAATGIRAVAAVDERSWSAQFAELSWLRELYLDIPAESL